MRSWLVACLGALCALALGAPALGQNLSATSVGAAFAAPYVTGTADGDVVTALVVTNVTSTAALLQLHVVDGDPGSDWDERSLDCDLTAHETTVITIVGDGGGADLAIECSEPTASPGTPASTKSLVQTRNLPGRRGIVFIALKSLVNRTDTLIQNQLVADWTVLDFAAGTAYSSEAIHFQAGAAGNAAPGATDKAFRFDGIEYSGFPSVVASNFVAPDCLDPGDATSCDVDVEVLLFTLDGRPGDAPPQAARLDFYNDDERLLDNVDVEFECLEIARLVDLDTDFNAPDLCDVAPLGCVGHFSLTPGIVDVFTGHDNPTSGFGSRFDDNERLSAFHGWIIHRFADGATVLTQAGVGGLGLGGAATTVRVLSQGPNTNFGLNPDLGGVATN